MSYVTSRIDKQVYVTIRRKDSLTGDDTELVVVVRPEELDIRVQKDAVNFVFS